MLVTRLMHADGGVIDGEFPLPNLSDHPQKMGSAITYARRYSLAAMCGIADGSGVCRPRPQGCTADCPGVCGCDGKTYGNDCERQAAALD